MDQWVRLTDERNAVIAPLEGSGIPGSAPPPGLLPPPGQELHSPVIFLHLNPADLSSSCGQEDSDLDCVPVFGHNSILPKELAGKFFSLPLVSVEEKGVGAVASWDSSIHDSVYLNRITQANERNYLIVKVVARLSHPTQMELVLRKRVCFSVIKRHSITEKIKKKLGGCHGLRSVSVAYEVVSSVPAASEELEDRASLAVVAAAGGDQQAADGETFIEKYRYISTFCIVDQINCGNKNLGPFFATMNIHVNVLKSTNRAIAAEAWPLWRRCCCWTGCGRRLP